MISLMLYGYLTYKDKGEDLLVPVAIYEMLCEVVVLCAWLSH